MQPLLFDSGVIASVLTAAVLILLVNRAAPAVPTSVIWGASVIAAVPFATIDPDRYRALSADGYRWWMIVLLLLASMVFVSAVVKARSDPVALADLTVAVAALAIGFFLFIPETDLIRLTPGPLVLIAAAVMIKVVRPIASSGALLIVAVLVWFSVIDGSARSHTMLATACCLVLASATPFLGRLDPAQPEGQRTSTTHRFGLALIGVGVLAVARVVGTTTA